MPRRRTRDSNRRVLACTADPELRLWIEHETFGERISVELVDTLADVLTSLTLTAPPWPQFLIIEADAFTAAEVELLAAIRQAGWYGMVIAIGDPSMYTMSSGDIDRVLPRSLECELLRSALKRVDSDRATTPLRRLAR